MVLSGGELRDCIVSSVSVSMWAVKEIRVTAAVIVRIDEEMDDDNREQALDQAFEAGFSEEQKRKFHEFADSPMIYDQLIDSLAPSIWENHDVKKGILC